MALKAQTILSNNSLDNNYSEQDAIHALYNELVKGVQSIKNGELYSVEEAWEEIDSN